MIESHWLELPISRTNFHGPKDNRAIEVWLYATSEGQVSTKGLDFENYYLNMAQCMSMTRVSLY